MKISAFQALLLSTADLTRGQREKLGAHLRAQQSAQDSMGALARHEPKRCRHCQAKALARNGTQNGQQRFLCRACGKSSCAASLTPLERLHGKERLAAFAQCLREGLSVRKTARRMGFSASRALRWRHRFLQNVVEHQPRALSGVVEIDETWLRRSRKGERNVRKPRHRGGLAKGPGRLASEWVPVLIGRSRGAPFVLDRAMEDASAASVDAALAGAVNPSSACIHADRLPAFKGLGKRLGVRCKLFEQGKKAAKGVHVQSANAYHERLRSWINRSLRGVSTKSLPLYLAWHRLRQWKGGALSDAEWIVSALGRQIINLK